MVFFLAFLAIGVGVGITVAVSVFASDRPNDPLGFFFCTFFGIFLFVASTVAIGAIGLGIAVGVGHATSTEYQFERQIDLVTLRDTSGVEGRFFLGTGRIDSTFYYAYYYETDNGGVRFGRIDADDAVVYEQDRDDALIKVYSKNNVRAFGIEFAGDRYEIFVPKGTVLRDYFKLDLE